MAKPQREYLSKEQVLEEFPFTPRQLVRMHQKRLVPTYQMNNRGDYAFKRSDLVAYLEARCIPAVGA